MSVAESGPWFCSAIADGQTAVLVLLRNCGWLGAHRRDEPRRGQREDMWLRLIMVGLALGVLVLVGLAAARGVHRADREPRVQAHRGAFNANLLHCAKLPVELWPGYQTTQMGTVARLHRGGGAVETRRCLSLGSSSQNGWGRK